MAVLCHAAICYMQVGVLAPEAVPTGKLCTGQVGYLITGMKTTKSARVGDTWHLAKQQVEALPGFKPAKSMVFSGQAKRPSVHPVGWVVSSEPGLTCKELGLALR